MKISFIPIRLREARKMCGYSLDQLAKAANVRVTRQSIYNYERGVMQPKPDMVKALAETLGVNESFFYGQSTKIDMPMLRSTGDNMLSEEDLQQLEDNRKFQKASFVCWFIQERTYYELSS